jgi:MFS family permease
MADDLEMDSTKYSIALTVFFVGYVVFEVPSNMILARTKPSIFLPTIMFLWGCVTIAMAWVPNYKALIGLRIVVGILEAGFAPGVLLILSSWYKPNEQAKRFGVYISAAILSGAFGGLIAGAIEDGLDEAHGLPGWKWLFIVSIPTSRKIVHSHQVLTSLSQQVEGSATAGFSIVASFLLLDFPENTKRLTDSERQLAIKRIEHGRPRTQGHEEKLGHVAALKRSVTDWRTWVFVVGYMAIVGSSTLSYFYPTLVQGLGYSGSVTQYMTVPIYIAAFVCTFFNSIFMDRVPQYRGLSLTVWMSIAMICSIVTCGVYNFHARYALLVLMASALWASNALSLAYASTTFGSMNQEVRGISLAIVNAMGNLAQIYGAYLFPDVDAPKYLMGFGVISGLCFTGVVSYFTLQVMLRRHPN